MHLKGLFRVNTALSQNDVIVTLPFESKSINGIYLRNTSGKAIQCALVYILIQVADGNMPADTYDMALPESSLPILDTHG